jgi:hypothetical protein
VRIFFDDLGTLLSDAATVRMRDHVVAMLDTHPDFEIWLLNPWADRTLAGRTGEPLVEAQRANEHSMCSASDRWRDKPRPWSTPIGTATR